MIGLFVVREEGSIYEAVDPVSWLLSNAPIWGFVLGRTRFIYDTILKARGHSPWRLNVAPFSPTAAEATFTRDATWDAWDRRWVTRLEIMSR